MVSALGFFGSIVLHELGHAFAALRNGIGISSIQLWIFGGMARMDRESDSPATEFKVAIAGPLVTLAIVVVLTAIGIAAAGWRRVPQGGPGREQRRHLGACWRWSPGWPSINLLVLVFNLLPAFPMDGGRIVRAIAWWRTGDRTSATRFAANLGRVFGYLFIGGGLLLIVDGDAFGGVWLALIGFVINGSARAASVQTAITSGISKLVVSDVMDREPVTISDRAQRRASARRVLPPLPLALVPGRRRRPPLPRSGRSRQSRRGPGDLAHHLPRLRRARATTTAPSRSATTPRSTRSSANRSLRRFGAVFAVDADGRLSGVITAEQVGRALSDAAS